MWDLTLECNGVYKERKVKEGKLRKGSVICVDNRVKVKVNWEHFMVLKI